MQGSITYNGHTLNLPRIARIGVRLVQERNDNYSSGRQHEAIVFEEWTEIKVDLIKLTRAQYNAMYAWWAYARQGEGLAFAADSNKTGNSVLDGGAASGQKVIPLAATAAFSVEDYGLIKQANGDDFEIVQIASISAGISVTAEDNLEYSYVANDIFQHQHYWPDVTLKDDSLDMPMQGPPKYDLSFTLIEEK